eukprot:5683469-Amphidinium_carterae.2
MKFLAKKFAEFHFDVLALQETRIPSNGLTKVGDYSCVGLASIKGHGGLQLWLHSRLKAQVLWHKSFGTRILAVAVEFFGVSWLYIIVHAPHDCSPQSAHDLFLSHLRTALQSTRKPRQRFVLLGDLNLRTKDTDARVAGPYALSSPLPGSEARTSCLLDTLSEHKLLLVNTWLTAPDHSNYTWRHRKGALAQIDYLAVTQDDYQRCMSCAVVPSLHFALDHPSDHSPVVLRYRVSRSERAQTGQLQQAKFANSDHALACQLYLVNSPPPIRNRHQSAAQWWEATVTCLREAILKTQPQKKATPRKDWLSQPTWQAMQYLSSTRKYFSLRLSKLNHFRLKAIFRLWQGKLDPEATADYLEKLGITFTVPSYSSQVASP